MKSCKSRRPDSGWTRETTPAILKAINNDNFEAATLLMEHCDVNKEFSVPVKPGTVGYCTNFQLFMHRFNGSSQRHMRGLRLFLVHGADVNSPHIDSPLEPRHDAKIAGFYEKNNIPVNQWPTLIDYYFHVDRAIFHVLFPYSTSASMRSTVLYALERGERVQSNLMTFLLPGTLGGWRMERFLQLLLAEQFLIGTDLYSTKETEWWNTKLDVELIQNIMQCGIDHSLPHLQLDATDLLCATIHHIKKGSIARQATKTVRNLLRKGEREAIIDSRVLHAAVQEQGVRVLKYFVRRADVDDIPVYGSEAITEAARLDNIEAVRLLSDLGVNVMATFSGYCLCAVCSREKGGKAARLRLSRDMVNFLVKRGAGLHVDGSTLDATHPLGSHTTLLEEGPFQADLFSQVTHLVDELGDAKDNPKFNASAIFLEGCLRGPVAWKERHERLRIFELFYRQGAEISPGSPLAVFIYYGGRKTLADELLDRGADINSYSQDFSSQFPEMAETWCLTPLQAAASCGNEELVLGLLERGGDVNAAAVGRLGKTALQHICSWRPGTTEERTCKMRITHTLLDHGADVNGAAAEWCGRTALQIVATEGDLEIANLLHSHGADVNAPQCARSGWVALDGAAYWGRLDMVQLLLNAGAISETQVYTKYDSAIAIAKLRGHFAIADLITDHANKYGGSITG